MVTFINVAEKGKMRLFCLMRVRVGGCRRIAQDNFLCVEINQRHLMMNQSAVIFWAKRDEDDGNNN